VPDARWYPSQQVISDIHALDALVVALQSIKGSGLELLGVVQTQRGFHTDEKAPF
jgi:hypothetical protein